MTREEAIKELVYVKKQTGYADEALDMAIKALEQEPCGDCVSRQAVLNKIKKVCFSREQEWVDFRVSQGSNGQRDLIINFIEDLPPVNPQPKTGRWIFDKTLDKHYYCSECKSMGVDYWDFCPYCGAKMSEIPTGSDPQESEKVN